MIIDSHTHIGTIPPFDMKVEELLSSMERFGIDFSLVSNVEAAEFDHVGNPVPPPFIKPQNRVLRETLAIARKTPDKLGVLPWLRIHSELPDAEFIAMIKDNLDIIYGLKLHPFHSRTAPDDPKLEPVYELAAELHLPVVSHTGGCEEAMSPHLYNAAKRHPESAGQASESLRRHHMGAGQHDCGGYSPLRKQKNDIRHRQPHRRRKHASAQQNGRPLAVSAVFQRAKRAYLRSRIRRPDAQKRKEIVF